MAVFGAPVCRIRCHRRLWRGQCGPDQRRGHRFGRSCHSRSSPRRRHPGRPCRSGGTGRGEAHRRSGRGAGSLRIHRLPAAGFDRPDFTGGGHSRRIPDHLRRGLPSESRLLRRAAHRHFEGRLHQRSGHGHRIHRPRRRTGRPPGGTGADGSHGGLPGHHRYLHHDGAGDPLRRSGKRFERFYCRLRTLGIYSACPLRLLFRLCHGAGLGPLRRPVRPVPFRKTGRKTFCPVSGRRCPSGSGAGYRRHLVAGGSCQRPHGHSQSDHSGRFGSRAPAAYHRLQNFMRPTGRRRYL